MARPTTAARRYAEAAFELAARDRSHDTWARDLDVLAGVTSDQKVRAVLANRAVPHAQREQLVTDLLGKQVSRPAVNLVRLLVDRGRADLLPTIAAEYQRLLNRQRGVVEAEVTSAAPLSADELEALRARIEAMAGTKVDLRTRVDESLIGGLTVKVAGRLLDASVRGRLERLRSQLVAGTRSR
jgi:F-type H+-transporting ATPase subunit delta